MRRRADEVWSVLYHLGVIVGCGFLLAPIVVILLISLSSAASIVFPPPGFTFANYLHISPEITAAFVRSLALGVTVVAVDLLVCVPAAFALVRGRVPVRWLVDAIFRSPLQIPGIVMAVAFYLYYSELQRRLGIPLRNDFNGLVIAHVIMSSPYMLGAITSRLYGVSRRLEDASYGLGASVIRTLWQVTLPQIRPALLAGSFIAFVISFEDVPVALFLAPAASQRTLPVALFNLANDSLSPELFAAAILILLFSIALVLVMQLAVGVREIISGI